jgi:hypothetical protein
MGEPIVSHSPDFDFKALCLQSLDYANLDNYNLDDEDIDYLDLGPKDASQASQSPSSSSPVSTSPAGPIPIPPAITSQLVQKRGQTQKALKNKMKSKMNRAARRRTDTVSRHVANDSSVRPRIKANHIDASKSIYTSLELKKLRRTKSGWLGLKDGRNKEVLIIYTLEELRALGFDIIEWDGV